MLPLWLVNIGASIIGTISSTAAKSFVEWHKDTLASGNERAKLAHDENRDHERRGKEQRGRQPFASEAEPGPGGLNHDKCSSCCFRKDWTVGPRSTLVKVATLYS